MSAEQVGIDLRLLGPVRACRNGVELVLGSARRTAVLCVLALHTGQSVSRDQLVTAVWGAEAPPSATGNIYTYVSTLRQTLEPSRSRRAAGQLVSSGGGWYQLHLPPVSVDVLRFESLRETARRQRSAGDTDAELATVAQALRLWGGDALAGVPGPFAERQRLRLTELRLATAERYTELLVGGGRHEEAIDLLRDLAAAYPHREDVRARLATMRPPADQTTSPSAATGGTPSTNGRMEPTDGPETRTAGVLAAGPWPRTGTGAALLFGRDPAVRRLRRAVAEAATGRGGSILLEGPAGMGKTALLTAALSAAPDGCRIGWAVGGEVARDTPLGTLRDCLDSALAAGPHQLMTQAPIPASVPDSDAAAEAVRTVRRAAADGPLVLVIDDLHRADPVTRRAWATLGGQVGELPLLLVAAVRPGVNEAAERSAADVVTLGPLDPDSAGALVRAVAPQPPERLEVARILDEAGGHPDYLRQLARHGIDPFPAAALAATVRAHLSPYPDDVRQVLRAVALLSAYEVRTPGTQPPGCTMAELAAATDHHLDELARMLAPVRAAGILAPGDRLCFHHRVVVRALCEGTPAALRVTLCRGYVERLSAAGTAPERVVALLLAGEVPVDDRFGGWLADHVERVAEAAPRIAVAALAQAHAQHSLDPALRLTLTAWLARLLLRQRHNAASEAGWVAARTADPDLAGEMRWTAAHSHERRGDVETAAEIAHVALRERRIGPQWIDRLRALLGRIRPDLPGNPTQPQISRSGLVGGERSIAS
ncbi:AAA family ATPase [Micromonospora sp. NPDC048898]|uniref:AAA family ATPase n=1 Tax=Micromonospora sp. NPDC048898 TaxID=3364260 RepID=UPI00371D9F42